jgi:hypothetical protein
MKKSMIVILALVLVGNVFAQTETSLLGDIKARNLKPVRLLLSAHKDSVTAHRTALTGKQDTVANVSDTEIGYLNGVTSAIQTQLDARYESGDSPTFVTITGTTYALTGNGGATLASSGDSLSGAVTAGVLYKSVFTLTNYDLSHVDADANGGHASLKLADLPEGYIKFIGASINVVFTGSDTDSITATATYDIGVGSVQVGTDNAVLATTEQDIINKQEGNMADSTATVQAINATSVAYDGTSTAGDIWLNVAIEADDSAGDASINANGTITVYWILLGDY